MDDGEGEKFGSGPNTRNSPDSWWGLRIDLSEAEILEAQLFELLEILLDPKDAILAISTGKDLKLKISSYARDVEESLVVDLFVEPLGKLHEFRYPFSFATY